MRITPVCNRPWRREFRRPAERVKPPDRRAEVQKLLRTETIPTPDAASWIRRTAALTAVDVVFPCGRTSGLKPIHWPYPAYRKCISLMPASCPRSRRVRWLTVMANASYCIGMSISDGDRWSSIALSFIRDYQPYPRLQPHHDAVREFEKDVCRRSGALPPLPMARTGLFLTLLETIQPGRKLMPR